MTSLLLRWLNEELVLSRSVQVLERDLSNGFLLAEVLHIHGLEDRLDKYTDSSLLSVRVQNLELLGATMARVGLGELCFTQKREILMETRATILKLVLAIKEFVAKKKKNGGGHKGQHVSLTHQAHGSKTRDTRIDAPSPIRDVEERFITETRAQFHPTKVQFDKGIDMAVHQRRFPQAQWAAENKRLETWSVMMIFTFLCALAGLFFGDERLLDGKLECGDRANKNASLSSNRTAMRMRMKEKRAFMHEWDQQRYEEWRKTQDLYLAAERDDLRLELTLEARKQRAQEAVLKKVHADAIHGVEFFEKNMNRLGLSSSSAGSSQGGQEAPLRAIPASDLGGAQRHLQELEQRVLELDFRPSNNVKMMKELRARRKAQLAAEKDRRMRRMKAMSDSKRASERADTASSLQNDVADATLMPLQTRIDSDGDVSTDSEDENKSEKDATKPVTKRDPGEDHQRYLKSKILDLEANYAQLRAVGSERREKDNVELARLRKEMRAKTRSHAARVCAEIVDALVVLAIAVVQTMPDGDDALIELKRAAFLSVPSDSRATKPSRVGMHSSQVRPTRTVEDNEEVGQLVQHFQHATNVWSSHVVLDEDQKAATDAVVAWSHRVDAFSQSIGSIMGAEMLDTTWLALPNRCPIVSILTSDKRSQAVARRVASDRHMQCLSLDALVDECITHSYDPGKQPEHALALGPRERVLGVFGPKVAPLRQKNTSIPETIAADIVVAVIMLCCSSRGSKGNRENTSSIELQEDIESSTPPTPALPTTTGCLLLNFPRTPNEAQLLSKAYSSAVSKMDEAIKPDQVGSVDSTPVAATTPSPLVRSESVVSKSPSESSLPPCATCIDAVVVITMATSDKPVSRAPTPSPDQATPNESITTTAEPSVEELQQRAALQQLETYLATTTRVIKVKPTGVSDSVVVETIHLFIDEYAHGSRSTDEEDEHADTVSSSVVECDCSLPSTQPEKLRAARRCRREAQSPELRVVWMLATRELTMDNQMLSKSVVVYQNLERKFTSALEARFEIAYQAITRASHASYLGDNVLDTCLRNSETQFDKVLADTIHRLQQATVASSPAQQDRILTEAEVALGDIVDAQRAAANEFVSTLACRVQQPSSNSVSPVLSMVKPWLEVLPLICFELKEYAVDVLDAFDQELYTRIGFLSVERGDKTDPWEVEVSPQLLDAVKTALHDLETVCSSNGLAMAVGDDIARVVGQLSSRFVFVSTLSVAPVLQHELHQQYVTARVLHTWLQQTVSVLRYTTTLVDNIARLHVHDVDRYGRYIANDLALKNETITGIITKLRTDAEQQMTASWPDPCPLLRLCTRSPLARRMNRHETAQFLSFAQLQSLIAAYSHTATVPSSPASAHPASKCSISQEAFVVTTLEVARREAFPASWRNAKSVASMAMEWTTTLTHSAERWCVAWRSVVFVLICTQFTGLPTLEAIEAVRVHAQALAVAAYSETTEDGEPPLNTPVLSRSQFLQLPLWCERSVDAGHSDGVLEACKGLLWMVLADTNTTAVLSEPSVDVVFMLLTMCLAPMYCSRFHGSDDISGDDAWVGGVREPIAAATLPTYSRGLFRVFTVLSRWYAACPVDQKQTTSQALATALACFTGMDMEASGCDHDERSWMKTLQTALQQDPSDRGTATAFLATCDAIEPSIAKRFLVPDTYAALLAIDQRHGS